MSSREIVRIARPTKLELIRLRRRLATARRIHRILRDRLTLLVQEFFIVIRKLYRAREELSSELRELYPLYERALALSGVEGLEIMVKPGARGARVLAAYRSVAGVRAPLIEVEEVISTPLPFAPIEVAEITKRGRRILEVACSIAELEKELQMLGLELERTRRRVNMLEHVLIPRLVNTIKYLRMKFEEREREEKARLKRVKTVLARRRGAA